MNGNFRKVLQVIICLVFFAAGIRDFINGDYLFGAIFMVVGIVFLVSLFIKKRGD